MQETQADVVRPLSQEDYLEEGIASSWQLSPVFLPGESHRQRSLVGYSPEGQKKESDMTEATERYKKWQYSLRKW